jgi:hypothetical protein
VDFVYIKVGEACGFSAFRLERFTVFWNAPKDTKQHRITSTADVVLLGIANFAFQLDFCFVGRRQRQVAEFYPGQAWIEFGEGGNYH